MACSASASDQAGATCHYIRVPSYTNSFGAPRWTRTTNLAALNGTPLPLGLEGRVRFPLLCPVIANPTLYLYHIFVALSSSTC